MKNVPGILEIAEKLKIKVFRLRMNLIVWRVNDMTLELNYGCNVMVIVGLVWCGQPH